MNDFYHKVMIHYVYNPQIKKNKTKTIFHTFQSVRGFLMTRSPRCCAVLHIGLLLLSLAVLSLNPHTLISKESRRVIYSG